ncbi:flagellar export protein FliJ [bacterium]|jgi:flagellar FliJ protein|nr:flagellar export protein FliJ [bacterium]
MKIKPFRFTLESVYNLRQEAVDRANDHLAREMLQLNREQQSVEQIDQRIEQAREGFREAMSSGTYSGLILQLRQFMVSLEQERTNRQSTLEGYLARVETCRKVVIAARRKLEAIEKIRAKRKLEYEAKWIREEQKEMDELMVQGSTDNLNVNFA